MTQLLLHHTPVELHHMQVSEDGVVTKRDPVKTLHFTFHHQGFQFVGLLDVEQQQPILDLRGVAGIIPFSIQDIRKRNDISEIVQSSSHLKNIRFLYRFDNRLQVRCKADVQKPVTAIHLLAATTETLLTMQPYLKMLTSYLVPDLAKAKH